MQEITPQMLELGALAAIFGLAVKEFFSYLKTKKEKNGNEAVNQQLLEAITEQNQNHLHTIQETISGMCDDLNVGNARVVKAITDMHTDLASRLGEIKGVLNNKR
jgi:hypothetical protein